MSRCRPLGRTTTGGAIAGVLAFLSVARAAPGGFELRGTSFCEAAWTDGADLLFYACSEAVRMVRRGARSAEIVGLIEGDPVRIDGAGRGRAAMVVVAGEGGAVGRYRAGRWEKGRAPLRGGDELVTAVVDVKRRSWLVARKSGLYLWHRGGGWRRVPYPSGPELRVRAATADAGGGLWIAGAGGEIYRFDGGRRFYPLRTAGLPPTARRGRIDAIWYGRSSGLLYAMTRGSELYVVEPRRGQASVLKLDSSWMEKMTGVETKRGDALVLVGSSGLFGLFKGAIYSLEGSLTFPKQLAINRSDRRLYAATQPGIVARSIEALLDPQKRNQLGRAEPGEAGKTAIALPRAFFSSAYLGMGPGWSFVEPETASHFALDLELGLRMPFALIAGTPLLLWPTIGYSFAGGDRGGGHLLATGLGITTLLFRAFITITGYARFLLGSTDDRFALGVRSGGRLSFLMGLLSVDVGHQLLYPRDGPRVSGLRLTFGIDLVSWFRALTVMSFLASPSWAGAKAIGRLFR